MPFLLAKTGGIIDPNNRIKLQALFLGVGIMLFLVIQCGFAFSGSDNQHVPSKELQDRWSSIEKMLYKKDIKSIESIHKLLLTLVDQENSITALIEQKASTQMGSISIVVAILLASSGFFLNEAKRFQKRTRTFFLVIYSLMCIVFVASIYSSYRGFVAKDNFASYNVDDLFNDMVPDKYDSKNFMVYNILENYQILKVNSDANETRANELILAARLSTIGLIIFSMASVLMIVTKYRSDWGKEG